MKKWNAVALGEPEKLEVRAVMDATGMCGFVDFPDSQWVAVHPDGTSLRFASLIVGRLDTFGDVVTLSDDTVVHVQGKAVRVGQVKEYLHGFADTIGTDMFPEFLDLRFAEWGTGSSPTLPDFEEYVARQLASLPTCEGLQFATEASFELPGVVNEPFFTGGWLDLPADGPGTLVTEGDIAEVVESYSISIDTVTTLTIQTHIREKVFTIQADGSLIDQFGGIWSPRAEYRIVHPDDVDKIMGDIDENGSVDFADFLVLSENFGTNNALGDLDCDGTVAFADFLILSQNFGRSSG